MAKILEIWVINDLTQEYVYDLTNELLLDVAQNSGRLILLRDKYIQTHRASTLFGCWLFDYLPSYQSSPASFLIWTERNQNKRERYPCIHPVNMFFQEEELP